MPDSLLRRALLGNAVFSASSGLILVVFARPLAVTFGVPPALLLAVGAGLVSFAAIVARVARHGRPGAVRSVIGADVAWVVSVAIVLALFGASMATAAVVALIVVTVAVADFAALQWWGLRRVRPAA